MKVMVGLSGGVDSAIAAYLLIKQGYDVVGGFMRNWDALANNDTLGNPTLGQGQCPQEKDYYDALEVAKKLGIPLYRCDFIKEYWDNVFSYFLKEYEKGRTPNPDVFCNKYIKFDSFLKFAKSKGCEMIAMGHYAKKGECDGHTYLYKAGDKNKDQSYFLSQINEEQIKSCLFPLSDITKPEVRKLAFELGLDSVKDKKDSTGVCFIGERNFSLFLENYLPAKEGDIVDGETNKVIGKHKGVLFYTIGQRHGLGIGGVKDSATGAYFIYKKDVKNNILYVSNLDPEAMLKSNRCIVKDINWVGPKPTGELSCFAKFRYRQEDVPAVIHFEGEDIVAIYEIGSKAVTPGQFAVFYDKDERMLGGGKIDEIYRDSLRIDI